MTAGVSHVLRLAAALAALNFAFTFENVWPTLWVQPQLLVSVEAALVVLALALYARAFGAPGPRHVAIFAVACTALAVGRYADVTVPALFGRPINLYWDGRQLPAVLSLAADGRAAASVAAGAGAVAAVVALVYLGLRWTVRVIADGAATVRTRRGLALAAGGLAAAFVASEALDAGRLFAAPVSATYAKQARFVADALSDTAADERLGPSPAFASNLRRLDGADVLVVFLESYGAATFDRPDYARALDAHRAALAAAARGSGRRIVSAFVRSPTFGGASWLAHASLLAGVDVGDAKRHDLLLTTRRPTLVRHFRDHGYDALALMPGLRADWPEGAFYGFDAILDSRALAYTGPQFGFWRIPDQYALARLDATALHAHARRPAFVFFPTITSHIPFQPLPPYQPDWARLLGDEPFDREGVARSTAIPDWDRLAPAYVATIGYAYDWLTGYLRRSSAARDYVLVVVGDHQPVGAVAGERAPWEVPVHVIARRAQIVDALVAAGFRPGVAPARPALGAMHDLTRVLLDAFDEPPPLQLAGESARAGAPRVDVP
ncbi:MAG: hypothetical protein KJ025_16045 [Burkholderiales bacterium]|nr:hypothetical protein [Burkholderiales bacterium]